SPSIISTLSLHDALPISHFRFEIVGDDKKAGSRPQLGSHDGGDNYFIAALQNIDIFHRLIGADSFLAKAGDGVTEDDAFGLCFRSEEHTSELQSRFDLVC